MVYTIDYIDKKGRQCCLFDIQVYLEHKKDIWQVGEGWRTECRCVCFGQGIAQYIYDGNIEDDETLKEFQEDVNEIVNIRGFLHEQHRNYWFTGNTAEKDSREVMETVFIPDIEKKLMDFAITWNFKFRK